NPPVRAGLRPQTVKNFRLDQAYARERAAETALWLDYKSFFVFADILVGGYVHVSELVWEARVDQPPRRPELIPALGREGPG
ncbi:MAG: hypothetical protein WD041_02795, partial [Nitriliruptoraceae bacterium]